MDLLHQFSSISDKFIYRNNEQVTVSWCYHITNHFLTQTLDWETAYQKYPNTSPILDIIQEYEPTTIPTPATASTKPAYKLLNHSISLHNIIKCLVYTKPILTNKNFLFLTVVQKRLRNKLFGHYHTCPSGGYIGELKTLYHLCIRFFWHQFGRLLINGQPDVPIVFPTTCGATKRVNFISLFR